MVFGWTLATVCFLAILPAAYFTWYILVPRLWNWSVEHVWPFVFTWVAFLFLFCVPIWIAIAATSFARTLLDLYVAAEEAEFDQAVQTVRTRQNAALSASGETDSAGLLPLLRYSQEELTAYYRVGLNQTRRSFLNSVLAMWLGFILLLAGVALYVGPVEKLGLQRPDQEFKVLIMGGAAIIEFISALFLWVYRNSTGQLTYFYNRQMHTHNVVMCFRIASTMQNPDDTKKLIVEKVLQQTWAPERPPMIGAKGFQRLLDKAK
jgi:hypothetical protein